MEKCKQLKVPVGKLLGQLKSGRDITFEVKDETTGSTRQVTVKSKDVLSDPPKARKIVVLGDCANADHCSCISEDADIIIHEVFFPFLFPFFSINS